jgi:putative colanic acid biosynthesis UDP-glucose lipid carrier transferase
MSKKNNRYAAIRYITDVPIVGLSYLLASSLTLKTSIWDNGWQTYFLVFVAIVIWYISTSFSHLYKDRRSNKYSEEIIFIIYTLGIYMIVLSSGFFFLNNVIEVVHTTQFFLLFVGLLFVFLTLTKYIIRKYLHSAIFHGKLLDNILIVGVTPSAQDFYETINRYYYYGYKCIGFLDDQTTKMNGCPYKGPVRNLAATIKELQVDEVVIALPNHKNKEIQDCIEICDQYATQTRILPDLEQYTSSNLQVNNIGLLSVINIRELPLDKSINRLGKRAFDIAFSTLFFILIATWLFPILMLIIKLSSRGPIFFKQERWGLNNQKITCYKFRTMMANSQDVNEEGHYQQASKGDPRITAIGAFLRRTNLDELPQFWNVLLGNMSVVGPRPHPTPLNLASMHTIDNYMLRHVVKPGISGWAQVNGYRGETKLPGTMQKRVNFDLYYIHRWTFWFDCQIILQTLINMIRGDQNAY